MDSEDEAVELLVGYDRWKHEQAQKEPDLSPRAYVALHRDRTLLKRLGEASEQAVLAITKLTGLLESDEGMEPAEREALQAVLAIAELVQEAA